MSCLGPSAPTPRAKCRSYLKWMIGPFSRCRMWHVQYLRIFARRVQGTAAGNYGGCDGRGAALGAVTGRKRGHGRRREVQRARGSVGRECAPPALERPQCRAARPARGARQSPPQRPSRPSGPTRRIRGDPRRTAAGRILSSRGCTAGARNPLAPARPSRAVRLRQARNRSAMPPGHAGAWPEPGRLFAKAPPAAIFHVS